MTPNFAEWARRVGLGDPGAEQELAEFFRPRLVCFFESRAAGRRVAEDLAQEALLAVMHALRRGQLRDEASLPGFVFGVARNQLASLVRREGQGRAASFERMPEPVSEPVDFERRQRSAQLRVAIGELEEKERTVLLLAVQEEKSTKEIAEMLGATQEVVRQRRSRALKKLMSRMQPLREGVFARVFGVAGEEA